MIIRNEAASDIDAITRVTIAAFRTLAISNHTEQFIINSLRVADALTISLVAEIDRQVVGHVDFSSQGYGTTGTGSDHVGYHQRSYSLCSDYHVYPGALHHLPGDYYLAPGKNDWTLPLTLGYY